MMRPWRVEYQEDEDGRWWVDSTFATSEAASRRGYSMVSRGYSRRYRFANRDTGKNWALQ